MAGAAEHEDLCEAALFYLLERLRLSLENPDETARVKLGFGRATGLWSMGVEEMFSWWSMKRYLEDPAVLAYLAEAAKTWRKKNAALVIATQSAVAFGHSKSAVRDRNRAWAEACARIHATPSCF